MSASGIPNHHDPLRRDVLFDEEIAISCKSVDERVGERVAVGEAILLNEGRRVSFGKLVLLGFGSKEGSSHIDGEYILDSSPGNQMLGDVGCSVLLEPKQKREMRE